MTDQAEILAAIDSTLDRVAAAHCVRPGCGRPLRPDGPSEWWCDDICQRMWIEYRAPLQPLPPVPDGGRCQFPDPLVRRRELPPEAAEFLAAALRDTASELAAGRYERARDAVPLLWRLLRVGRRT